MTGLFRRLEISIPLIKCNVVALYVNDLRFRFYILKSYNESYQTRITIFKKYVSLVEKMTQNSLLKMSQKCTFDFLQWL